MPVRIDKSGQHDPFAYVDNLDVAALDAASDLPNPAVDHENVAAEFTEPVVERDDEAAA
jgi:hypothetical protein